VNRTKAAICLATYHANAAAKRARATLCPAGAAPPPPPAKLFALAMACDAKPAFHSNG